MRLGHMRLGHMARGMVEQCLHFTSSGATFDW